MLFLAYLAFSSGLAEFWKALGAAGNKALGVTLMLMIGVAVLTAITGTGLAYLISFFPWTAAFGLAGCIAARPAAPIAAYGLEFLDYAGLQYDRACDRFWPIQPWRIFEAASCPTIIGFLKLNP